VSKADEFEIISVNGCDVRISHPQKLYFSHDVQLTKLDIVRYFLAVAPGALQGIAARPIVLKRFVNGACLSNGRPEPFYQKRAPSDLPPWMRTVTLSFPSGRTAEEVVVDNAAGLVWVINLGCIELHPHPVLASDLDHPNELRVDLDPGPGVEWEAVKQVALVSRAVLAEHNLVAWPKTSGSRGMHVNVRIQQRWSFTEVRRAALALAREVERRVPALASSKWWKEERHGVFLDYNQNAKDRTTASAYSVRPLPDARVSAPLRWDEVPACDPADFTVLTMPARFASYSSAGDPHAAMDESAGSLDSLLELAARDEALGLGDAPWPPHFAKAVGEGPRVAPSRAKKAAKKSAEADKSTSVDDTNKAAPPPNRPKLGRTTRTSKMPLIVVAQSPDKTAAEGGLERWKSAHPEAAPHLAVDDILTDRMRGSASIWYRIRVNLRHVPEESRPAQQTPDPDDDPTRVWRERQ
jgi:bifunctional non-homologous end joining protein LigD